MVYAVCSLEPEEGEDVVNRFLGTHAEFEVDDPRPHLPAQAHRLLTPEGFLLTSAADGELDGFFAARLVRRMN